MATEPETTIRHTAGPWFAFDDEIVSEWADQHICTVALEDGINPTEWQANMRLIAAAPSLLQALKAIVKGYDGPTVDAATAVSSHIQAARMAIAKAEGR